MPTLTPRPDRPSAQTDGPYGLVDELGRAQRRERAREDFQVLLVGLLWTLWGFRFELALVVALAMLQRLVAGMLGDVIGGIAVALVIAAAMLIPPVRRRVVHLLRAMRLRRAWARATIDSGVASGPFRCPGRLVG